MINDFSKLKPEIIKHKIVDSHIHMGPLGYLYMPSNNADKIIDTMKEYGIKKAVCSAHSALSTVKYGVKETLSLIEKYPDFLYAYLVFNPNFEEFSFKQMDENLDNKNIVGIKLHPSWHACYPRDKKYERFWGYIEDRGLPVLTHSWNPNVANKAQKYSDPFFFEEIVKKHKKLNLILAHAGGRGEMLYKVISLLERNENLYVDFAGDIFVPDLIEEYIDRAGSERILFGSDMPWIDFRFHIENILSSHISEKDRANIFSLNAQKLFKISLD